MDAYQQLITTISLTMGAAWASGINLYYFWLLLWQGSTGIREDPILILFSVPAYRFTSSSKSGHTLPIAPNEIFQSLAVSACHSIRCKFSRSPLWPLESVEAWIYGFGKHNYDFSILSGNLLCSYAQGVKFLEKIFPSIQGRISLYTQMPLWPPTARRSW